MDAITFDGSDDDADVIEDQTNPKKRAKCGRNPSDVWNEITPVNPGPNGEHKSCKCKHCNHIFNHPIKQRAHRMLTHLEKCAALLRSKEGVSRVSISSIYINFFNVYTRKSLIRNVRLKCCINNLFITVNTLN